MIRRLLVLPLLALCLVLGACSDEGKKDVAVVDVARIARESEPGKALNTFLENMQKDFNQRLMAQQEVYQQNTEDAAARQTLETMFMSMQQRLQTEEENATSSLLERILQTINTFRESRGYSVILRNDVVLSNDKAVDVTDQVLVEVNKIEIEYRPVTADQPGLDIPAVEEEGASDGEEGTADGAAADGAQAEDGDAAAPATGAQSESESTGEPAEPQEFESEADSGQAQPEAVAGDAADAADAGAADAGAAAEGDKE